jgi:polysaccharide deacetylase family protein (PEP-CTERM system associated)
MLNALTIDLEDWFQVSNVEHIISREQWGECEVRLFDTTRRLLQVLDRAGVQATFFVLGWNARRFPELIREVQEAGHEIGSHGYAHRLIFEQTPEELAADLAEAEEAIGTATGVRPQVYRAPSFSITPRSVWAFDVLAQAGFTADSSVFPIFHERYGFQEAPRLPHRVVTSGEGSLLEAPPSTIRLVGRNYPFAGGAYFRLLPYPCVRSFCRQLGRHQEPVVFYIHPWELDAGFPRFPLSPFRRLRSYANLDKTEIRLARLLRDFPFGTLSSMLHECQTERTWRPVDLRPAQAEARVTTRSLGR